MSKPALVAALLLPLVAHAEDPRISRIVPSGDDLGAQRQITIAFDRAVVPLGRMERKADEVPATVTPDPGCEWRWLDSQVLACNLGEGAKLLPATAYTVEVRPGLGALDGAVLRKGMTQRFTTERPRVQYAQIVAWRGPEQPELRVHFNQPVTAASVKASLRFGPAIEVGPDVFDADTPFWTPDGEARQLWRIWPAQALRADRSEALTVSPGLVSAFGEERGLRGDSQLEAHTFPALRLIGLRCSVADGSRSESRLFTPGEAVSGCVPLDPVSLEFSAPVSTAELRSKFSIEPSPDLPKDPDFDPWANSGNDRDRRVSWPHVAGQTYSISLPFALAAESSYALKLAAGLQDRFGRTLADAQTIDVSTGARMPELVTDHPVAVLEAGVDTEVPAIVTNLDALLARYTRMTAKNAQPVIEAEQASSVAVTPLRNIAFKMPLGVRGMLAGHDSGALRGTLELQAGGATLGEDRPRDFFVTVSPWQIHAKVGHSNSLVWVTSLADGQPVSDAEVQIVQGMEAQALATARTDSKGIAQLPGSAIFDPKLERQWSSGREALAVRVLRGGQLALLPLQYSFEVDIWRASRGQFWSSRTPQHGHLRSWGTTAQGVYRAGEQIQYKIYVRDDSAERLAPAPAGRYALTVYDAAGAAVHERKEVALNRFGALDGAFTLGRNAAVGWYRFELKPDYLESALEPLRVLVADFVPAPFRVSAEVRAKQAAPGVEIPLQVEAKLQGGGPFGAAKLRAQARLQSASFEPGHPLAKEFNFDSVDDSGRDLQAILDQTARLDAQGEWQSMLKLDDGPVMIGQLLFEAGVEDDRGRSIVGRGSQRYFARDRYVGLHAEKWMLRQGSESAIDALVVNQQGEPQRGVPYYVKVERKETRGARVKGAGNAYITRYTRSWVRVATCKGRSTVAGMSCRFTPDAAGEFRITAMVRDSQDRLHQSHYEMYAEGSNAVLWEESPDYSLDVRAEKDSWAIGQTARYLVKNPFPGARALVTVERYGVLHQEVRTLDGSAPVIEIPVKAEYAPGAYVSVTLMSPRVEAPVKDGVDLGKPTFRMGYARLNVDEPYRQIEVRLKPAREIYRPRETVSLQLQAKAMQASGKAEPIEFAVAVLDKAVFDLIQSGAAYFDPLKGFTTLDGLDLSNYSLLTQLIGRQKFEKKGASPGGDGGADLSLRSVERFVAYWNPALVADADGKASISFELPDQLTGWRVLAMAVTPTENMGLGQTDISVTKPTELRPAMPNQLAVGDQFNAGFTVLNRAGHARKIEVAIKVEGGAQGEVKEIVELASFERRTVQLPLTVQSAADLQFRASAGDDEDRDALAHRLPVRKPRITATAADLSDLTAQQPVTQTIEAPAGAVSTTLNLVLTPTLLGALDGAFAYQRDYPHDCWEQRLGKATMAAQYLKLKPRLGSAVTWPDADAQIQRALADASSFQAPNGGMAFFVADDSNVSPYLSAFTGLAFGWIEALGHAPPVAVWDALDEYLLGLLRADPSAQGYDSREARAQLRAVVLLALAQRGKVDAGELARHGEQLSRMGLFGESLFWQAARQVEGGSDWADRARQRVLARANESAGRLSLEDSDDGAWAWLLGTPVRSNCAALGALVAARAQTGIGELPQKLTRHVSAAQQGRTHWGNTQENLYCAQALIDYSEAYEREPVDLQVQATLGGQLLGKAELKPGSHPLLSAAIEAPGLQQVRIEASGTGRGYASTRVQYIEPDGAPAVSAGLSVRRSYAVQRDGRWQVLQPDARGELELRQGDLLRVDLDVDVPAPMTYVVVDDPVPGGIEPLNPELATTAGIDETTLTAGAAYPWPFYHRELRFEAVRHYADYVGQGQYRLSWFGQAIAAGSFAVPRSHVEQMYEPDVHGNGTTARLRVLPGAP